MYCQECGMKLPEGAKFCSNCGTKVQGMPLQTEELVEEVLQEADAEVTQEIIEEAKAEVQAELSATEAGLTGKKLKKDNKKSKKKLFGIIAGVFVVLAVIVGGFFEYLENRTLYTLVNPELFFGECTTIIVMKDAPGESNVTLFFESETDMWDEVINYVNIIEQTDTNLGAVYNNDPRAAAGSRTRYSDTWHYYGDAFWPEYSLMVSNRVVTLEHFEEKGKYVVMMSIDGYQNCEFLNVNPYDLSTYGDGEATKNWIETIASDKTETSAPTKEAEKPSVSQNTQATVTPKPTLVSEKTKEPEATKALELVAEEIDVATAVQPPKNAFQDFASWSMGEATTNDTEQLGDSTQYIEYAATQETVDAYIEMLQQNGFTLVDSYYFHYDGETYASWGFDCDYVPNAGKVEVMYENSSCHLCIYTADKNVYKLNYSSDLTQYDLGLRKDGSVVNATVVKGPSAGAGLYRSADGVYTTTDGRLSASMNKATIIRDGKKDVCNARSEIKGTREWLWVEDYYRNEAICFGVLQDYTMAGDLYQFQDLKREKYYNDDVSDVYFYKWGDQPIFEMMVDEKFTGPLVTAKNKFEEVTIRVMHYEEGEEAVYYIYAKTKGTPSEIEVLCAVGLNVEEAENDAENAIVLSVGETHTLTYSANVFGAKSEVYSWSISGGDGIYADGTGTHCKVTAMKRGTGKVTVTCVYTVEVGDILTGNPTTEQRTKSKTWYFKVE